MRRTSTSAVAVFVALALALALAAASLISSASLLLARSDDLPDGDPDRDGSVPFERPVAGDTARSDEPFAGRWRRRFPPSRDGFLFFAHMRKAGGTTVRNRLRVAMDHHGHASFLDFLRRSAEGEVRRHFSFLDSQKRELALRHFNETKGSVASTGAKTAGGRVFYAEKEFAAMDWRCPEVDPRWDQSLTVVALRHPIERHLSEFFYSGPPSTAHFDGRQYGTWEEGKLRKHKGNLFEVDRKKLSENTTYAEMLRAYLGEELRRWARRDDPSQRTILSHYFGMRYVDNHQLRFLAGCASGGCLSERNVSAKLRDKMDHKGRPPADRDRPIDSVCTRHQFYMANKRCSKDRRACPDGCEGPCEHPAAAWGAVRAADLERATRALRGFDAVLISERLDSMEQMAFLADMLNVPRAIMIDRNESKRQRNAYAERGEGTDRHRYYRDLLAYLKLDRLLNSLKEENRLEIELYNRAARMNELMIEEWKSETKGLFGR